MINFVYVPKYYAKPVANLKSAKKQLFFNMKSQIRKYRRILYFFLLSVILVSVNFFIHLNIGSKPIIKSQKPDLFLPPPNQLPLKTHFIYKSATELAELVKSRKATSVEIVQEFISNIKNNNYKYNAIVWLRESEALDEAKKADEAVVKGGDLPPLLGVPITVKEEFWVKGSPVTLNSKMNDKFIAPVDGPIVQQLKKAGAIILGKTNLPTLLLDFQVQGEVYSVGSNPYDTTKTPGGSTGGGASALAAGFTSLEFGSDLGGSIRVPASFCGLYGLKTTFGTINVTEGDGTEAVSTHKRFALNTAGPLARTPEDLEVAWNVLKETRPDNRFQQPVFWKQPSGRKISEYKIAWTDDWKTSSGTIKVGNDVKVKMSRLIDSVKKYGAGIKKYAPDTYEEMMNSYLTCLALIAGEGKSPEIRQMINKDMHIWDDDSGILNPFYTTMMNQNDSTWIQWQQQNNKLKRKWDSFFSHFDFFICPITYGAAFNKCPKGSAITIEGITVSYFRYFPYATILNPIECPAITIPLGLNDEGLPIAIQVIGPKFSEPELLHFAKLLKPLVPGFLKPDLLH